MLAGDLRGAARVVDAEDIHAHRDPGRTAAPSSKRLKGKSIIVWSNVGESVVYRARTLNSQIDEPFFCVQIVLRSTSRSPTFLPSRSAIFTPSMQPIRSFSSSDNWSGGIFISG